MKKAIFLLTLIFCTMSCTENGGKGRDAMEVILHRSSVRSYTDEKVSDEDIQTLLKAGMAAPSAMNWQPWSFVVVNTREDLDSLAATNPHAKMMYKAPLAIVVCGKTEWAVGGGESVPNPYWDQDCSAVTQNILLAADYLGLGAVWTGCFPREERTSGVKKVLGIPEGVEPLSVIVIGHPAKEYTPKDKWNPDCIHYNKW